MAFHKSHSARREWKMNACGNKSGLTNRQFIRMMMEAEHFSAVAQAELDKKRSKKKEEATASGD